MKMWSGDGTAVLSIEDCSLIRGLIRKVCMGHGMRFSEARSAADAIRLIDGLPRGQGGDLPVLVLDLHLWDGLDGRSLLQLARGAGFEGPAFVLTAEPGVDPESIRSQGADALLAKPFDPRMMLGAIRSWAPSDAEPGVVEEFELFTEIRDAAGRDDRAEVRRLAFELGEVTEHAETREACAAVMRVSAGAGGLWAEVASLRDALGLTPELRRSRRAA